MREILKSALRENPDEYSIRRIVFLFSFLYAAVVGLLGFWFPMSETTRDIAVAALGLATTAVVGGRFAEQWKGGAQ